MVIVLISFSLGFAGSWVVMRHGDRIGAIDVPNCRSSHHREIPKGAGLGILAALIVSSLLLAVPYYIWFPAMVISLASFWGADKHVLPVFHRLAIHFGCSLFFLYLLLHSQNQGPAGYVIWLPVLVFIVGTANFYNFMDGIDGIAGITGFLAFLLIGVYAGLAGMGPNMVLFSLSVASACLAFLCFSFPKASVFWGMWAAFFWGLCLPAW